MDLDLEQQLAAALERRASAVPFSPSDLADVRSRARSIRRRRVAAGGVAGAAVVALVVPLAWGVGGLRGGAEPPVATRPPVPTSSASPSPTVTCSATGVPKPAAPTDLPAPVLETWQQIVDAAAACDLDALEVIGKNAHLSYGAVGGIANLRRWEEEGDGKLGTLLKLLGLSHAAVTQGEPGSYAWPAAYTRPTWDAVPQAERDELRAIHTPQEIAGFADFGGYAGWRLGIAADGTWSYFIAGD